MSKRFIAVVLISFASVIPLVGCGSKEDDKQPKMQGPVDPKIQPASPGGGKGANKPGDASLP